MREFRLTPTCATKYLLRFSEYRIATGLPPATPISDSPFRILETLSKSWFSTSRSTEEMTRGTVNENAVINTIGNHVYVDSVHGVGMLCNKERSWIAASPDAIADFDLNACYANYFPSDEPKNVSIALVEIKTAVARAAFGARTNIAFTALILYEMDTNVFRAQVPKEHAAHIFHHQCLLAISGW